MLNMAFSRGGIVLFIGVSLCAGIGSAQSCPATVSGFYTYTAIGNGVPNALLTETTTTETGTTGTVTTGTGTKTNATTPPFSNTGVGQLVNGTTNSVPFASAGTLYFDGAGNIRASSAPQFVLTSSVVVGTYTLNSDCTISVTLNDAFGTNTTKVSLQGVILGDGSEIDLGVLQNTSPTGTGTGTGSGTSTGTSSIAPGVFRSNILIRLVRPVATFCNASTLAGFRMWVVAEGTTFANSGTTGGTGTGTVAQAGTPFFIFGHVQFDGSGNLLAPSGSQSSLGMQFVGTYTVNNDCTGTLTLNSTNGTTGTTTGSTTGTTSSLPLNFVLTSGNQSSISSVPEIQFTQSSGTQILLGSGRAN